MKQLFIAVPFIFWLSSCATDSNGYRTVDLFVWDDSVPKEECAVINFMGYFPSDYNETPLNNPHASPYCYIQVPAGQITFSGRISTQAYSRNRHNTFIIVNESDIDISYKFEAGKYYCCDISFTHDDNDKKIIHLFMDVYEGTKPYMGLPWYTFADTPEASIPLNLTYRIKFTI
ncbi:MAG: hypothetical protein LBJ31_05705 [Treponema sp.]|jgi:hypothetical protein|nr:hypothetical protein [Treponema sp.]